MKIYTIGIKIGEYKEIPINSSLEELGEHNTFIMLINKNADDRLSAYYSMAKDIILANNRLIAIGVVGTMMAKQIYMLMSSYKKYDIYEINSEDELTKDLIDVIIDRNPTKDEVENFIGCEITAYAEITEIVNKIVEAIRSDNEARLKEIINNNIDSIYTFNVIIDYMKKIIEDVNDGTSSEEINRYIDKINEYKESLTNTNKQLAEKNDECNKLAEELQEVNKSLMEIKSEALEAKQRASKLEEQINNQGPIIRTYSEVKSSTIKCRVKSILYFKEISPIRYINSFVISLVEGLKLVGKLKVKLVIYDNKSFYTQVYKPLNVVSSVEYMSNRDLVVNKTDKIVVVDANQGLIEDIAKADYDVVVIYDRLKQPTDIITGNNVYKYWVANSMMELDLLEKILNINYNNVITRPGVRRESIGLGEIDKYNSLGPSAKVSKYTSLINDGADNRKIFNIIIDRINIGQYMARGLEA